MGKHHAEGDHGDALGDDVIDEEVAAAGQGSAEEAGNADCSADNQTHQLQTIKQT